MTCLSGNSLHDTIDEFRAQSEMSLIGKLYESGFPVTFLDTQWQQHEVLFRPLNELSYEGQIKTATSKRGELKEHRTLMGEIAGSDESKIEKMTDEQRRMLYVQVNQAPTMKCTTSKSRANPGYVAYMTQKVLPVIRKHFGKQTSQKTLLLVPYARQHEMYRQIEFELLKNGWNRSELPRLTTIDSARGRQAKLVILDLTNDNYEGFMNNLKRCCVAWSRAEEQMIVIGGAMDNVNHDDKEKVIKDATDSNKWKTIKYRVPLAHWLAH